MKILEHRKRLRQQNAFWYKVTVIFFLVSIFFGILRVLFITPAIEREKAEREVRTGIRLPPPATNSLSDR